MTKVTIERIGDDSGDWSDVVLRSPHAQNPASMAALTQLLSVSEVSYVGKYEGRIACIWGLVPPTLLSQAATLWLLPTDLVTKHQFLFVRYSQLIIERLLKKYPMIIGTTDARDKSAIRWIKWLGGEYSGYEKFGLLSFVIRKK